MGATTHLLDLQALDLAIDRLRARKAAIESGGELTAARADADAAEARLGEHTLQLDALDRDATKVEHEVDSLSQKAAAEEQRMGSGAIANARELEAIGHEITNLKRRISDREDELLAIMERREAIEAGAKEAESVAVERRTTAQRVAGTSADELGTVGAELAAREAERPSLAATIDPETLDLYEELRPQKKGVGAAALIDNVCQGCHEQLSSVELEHARHADGIVRCDHCRRILVL
ncbi:MAG: C4-type zinc ribbon domain-containing protein [Actinomycetota bacterium]